MDYKNSKWAKGILARQSTDGLWTGYHNLSVPRKDTDSMEENLRRLEILGYTIDDEPIQRTIQYLEDNLNGKKPMLDNHGNPMQQDFFVDLINATWIRRFKEDCENANAIAMKWLELFTYAFANGTFEIDRYAKKYRELFAAEPFKWAAQKQRNFYEVSILTNALDEATESAWMNYLLEDSKGIYYVYQNCLSNPPTQFQSKETVYYLSAIYLLLRYKRCRVKLEFVKDWIMEQQETDGVWDMGSKAKNNIIFPLSDDWKSEENRKTDCTWFIHKVLERFE